ncbi:Dcg1p [Sporobolomyces koalae]|uniref:Dcg1p n=1 Tax=Sporobolomyces koalae TaxID=500713 RepID=UPI003176DBB9
MTASPGNTAPKKLLIINPNSTEDITVGIADALNPRCPPGCQLEYFTGPAHAPTAIRDYVTGIQTATACFDELVNTSAFERYDGFLVCCFSDHPLQHMIREHLGPASTKYCVGMFEAGISQALMFNKQFGIVSTGEGFKPLLKKGVSAFLGASASDRFVGSAMSGIQVEELRNPNLRAQVETKIKEASAKVAIMGADTIIMGCGGMAGMELLVLQGVREAGLPDVKVIDAALAGLVFLAGVVSTGSPV